MASETAATATADGFRALNEKSLPEYIKATPALSSQFGDQLEGITVKEVGDGNLNFVYIVVGPVGSMVIKQHYKEWILRAIEETWNLFQKKFISLWDEHGKGDAYLLAIYNKPDLLNLVQKKYMQDLFQDSLGFGAAKMIRRIVGVAHVEDFESISDASKRSYCERRALNLAKMILKERGRFETIGQVISAAQEFSSA